VSGTHGRELRAKPSKKDTNMFGKVKRWLGIEGVKVTLVLPEAVLGSSGVIEGQLKFESMHTQTVESIYVTLFEKYSRGRFKNKLADLYKIGEIELATEIVVEADTPISMDFELPFTISKSEMDELGDKNIIMKKIVGAAKKIKNVKSEYHIEAEARVKGTALHPFDKQIVKII
jgi:hypothetical protein